MRVIKRKKMMDFSNKRVKALNRETLGIIQVMTTAHSLMLRIKALIMNSLISLMRLVVKISQEQNSKYYMIHLIPQIRENYLNTHLVIVNIKVKTRPYKIVIFLKLLNRTSKIMGLNIILICQEYWKHSNMKHQ